MANGLKLGELGPEAVKITAMRLGDGCKEYCISCGAYPVAEEREDIVRTVTAVEVDEARIRQMLEREVEGSKAVVDGVRLRLVDFFARYVTTDVNQEPLNGDAFGHFMRLVKQLSGGKSKAVCVSHGLRVNSRGEPDIDGARRLSGIVDMLDQQDVFVLSLDMARSRSKFGQNERNQNSYVETLHRLRSALKKGARITISIQGVEDAESPLFKGKAYELCSRVLSALKADKGWSDAEIAKLKLDDGRSWVGVGRSEILPGVNPSGECPVVPDTPLVVHDITRSQGGVVLNGVIDAVSGDVLVHPQNISRGYNDLARVSRAFSAMRAGKSPIEWGSWQTVYVNSDPIEDLSGDFNRRVMDRVTRREEARLRSLSSEGAARQTGAGSSAVLTLAADGVTAPEEAGFLESIPAEEGYAEPEVEDEGDR